ncbi:MAG: hypothetical protein HAW67_00180, partial [Endozoicomonadaceae bacterium]|nr:hypothetical protein [Endozoicomonadaceae bacterium]
MTLAVNNIQNGLKELSDKKYALYTYQMKDDQESPKYAIAVIPFATTSTFYFQSPGQNRAIQILIKAPFTKEGQEDGWTLAQK